MKILIVDDSETVRAILIKTLRVAKIETEAIFQACHGKDALNVLASQDVDVVFTDINMPEMNGVELVRRMADTGLLETIAVIVLSTDGSEARQAELKQMGISAYVQKPFRPEHIRDVIQQVRGAGNVQ